MQITTELHKLRKSILMSLILQRYYFFCKSQLRLLSYYKVWWCLWYYKGTIFFANHNRIDSLKKLFGMSLILQRYYFFCKSQRFQTWQNVAAGCLWYYKGTIFFANHNRGNIIQITNMMSLILQRYYFFCKSQQREMFGMKSARCLWYYKGTIFFANHNRLM